MNGWLRAGFVLLWLSGFAGCDDGSANDASAAALEGTRWKLAAWSASALAPADFDITADFAEGRIGGRSAVNSYGGDYAAAADGSFSTGTLAMTEMAGEPSAMRAESRYIDLLGRARRWHIYQGQLTLTAPDGGFLTFKPR